MDYKGQALCESIYQGVIGVAALIGLILGYALESFWISFVCSVAGLLVSSVLCIPDWPLYNRHPLPWQTPDTDVDADAEANGPQRNGSADSTMPHGSEMCSTCLCGTIVHAPNCADNERNKGNAAAAATSSAANTTAEPTSEQRNKEVVASSDKKKSGKKKGGRK